MSAPANGNGNGIQRWIVVGIPAAAVVSAIFGFFVQLAAMQTKVDDFRDRIAALEKNQATDRLDITNISASLREVERQFCGESQLRNLTQANQMRINASLWQKSGLGTFSTDNAYYPTLGCETKPEEVKR